jgi:hypothetical protein
MYFNVKVLVVIGSSAYAGLGVLIPQIEAEAQRLWQKFCATQTGEGKFGMLQSTICKIATEANTGNHGHSVNLPKSAGGQQVVFVHPLSVHYTDDVTGGGVARI